MSSDQDSGFVYEQSNDDRDSVKSYFLQFAAIIVNVLKQAGYPPCEGNVLSDQPEWCLDLQEWKAKLGGWFAEPAWESVRYLLIMADGRAVYGEQRLADELKSFYYEQVRLHPPISRRMLDNTMRHKVLLNLFGQLLKEQYGQFAGSLDIKYGAYIPMVNASRLLAIEAGVRETSTLSRLRKLSEIGKLTKEEGAKYEQAFRLFVRLRLMTISVQENGWYANNGKLASSSLTKEMTDELKSGLRIGKKLQRRVYKKIMGSMGRLM
ncbi:putative nucleotidyltransferase substrate binding domain-containing protein [Paenibacillus protaetiae]|uniref:putative nucleotidyltransferase substrate binding domain-containing protein n=1 Tax=Paenibacillus protaetiae TaxID=2509456 RepID=UPI001FC8EE87|nr:putative nucleotidyltransferase substrate binding domain-containing protein [Paenibacillus protaetiae]